MRYLKLGRLRLAMVGIAAIQSFAFSAWVHFDPADTTKVPKLFSQTGFYTNMTSKAVTSEAVAFNVNSPLWSDNASKFRWVILKPGSTKIKFDPAQDYFEYPDGAVFVKLFKHDTVPGDPKSEIFWETRLIINKKFSDTISTSPLEVVIRDHWHPFSYRWKRDGSDAQLVGISGEMANLTLTIKGQKSFRKWLFPSVAACNRCHRQYASGTQGRTVLGFYPPQLNRPSTSNASLNQIRELFQKNIFAWDKAVPTEDEVKAMPKWASISDTTAPLELRARSYLAANCAGCHGKRGIETDAIYPAGEDINYDYYRIVGGSLTPEVELRDHSASTYDIKPLVLASGDTLYPKLVVPGYPELSSILYRLQRRNMAPPEADTAYKPLVEQMPPLAVYEVDTVANRWIAQWIKEMPPVSIHGRRGHSFSADAPKLVGDMLVLPGDARGKVMLSGIDGRHYPLARIIGNTYRLPSSLPGGVYMIRVGSKSFKLMR